MKTKMVRPKTGMSKQKPSIAASGKYILRLYIAGQTRIAVTALNNLKSLCKSN